jgi:hypothetical protein
MSFDDHPIAYIREKIYIRSDIASDVDYRTIFDRHFYKEKDCSFCAFIEERPSEVCFTCRSYLGSTVLYEEKLIKGMPYVGVPWGDQLTIEKIFNIDYDDDDVVDQRAAPKMPHKLKWVKPLYTGREIVNGAKTANQVRIVEEWAEKRHGIIQASPRTGKSTCAAYIGTRMGLRVLITAHESTLCRQMAREYIAMTNVEKVARRKGLNVKELIYHIDDNEPISRARLKKACVVSVNYQKFIRDPRKARILRNLFGILFVDEVHQASATSFAEFVNRINARYRCGLSATPDRRDRKHIIGRMLIGPVTVVSDTMALIPRLSIIQTGVSLPPALAADPPRDGGFGYLSVAKRRNVMIVENVMADLAKGHTGIIVPVGGRKHLSELRDMFVEAFDGDKSKVVTYYGGANKEKKIADFEKDGKVLVAMWQMVKQGITLKKASCLHIVLPRSDPQMFYQLANRVCTPFEGKPSPEIRIYIDDLGISRGCFNAIFWEEILKHLKGRKNVKTVRYYISKKDELQFFSIARSKTTVSRTNTKGAGSSVAPVRRWRF